MCLVISAVAYPSLRFLFAIIYHLLLDLSAALYLYLFLSFFHPVRFSRHAAYNFTMEFVLEPLADALHSLSIIQILCTLSKCLRSRPLQDRFE